MEKTIPTSPRLSFRLLRLGDEEITFAHIDNELTQHWIGWEPSYCIQEERWRLAWIIKQSPSAYFMVFRDGAFVGMCGLSPEIPEHEELGVDVWVTKESQGNGFGFEMVVALIDWARINTDKEYLVYSVTDGNKASRRIANRLGLLAYQVFFAEKRGVQRSVSNFKIALR